jgi:aminoglycoside 3-N-acetyltransferase
MFTDSNIPEGRILLLHSSISRTLKRHECAPNDVLLALLKALGPEGTLLLPLFNFDFTKGTPFDMSKTPSHMGALTEAGRHWPGAVRTGHPVYSFVAIGAKASAFKNVANRSGYGHDSPFAMLRKMNGIVGVLDLPDQDSMTFIHHVEEMLDVPYRYHKDFSGRYIDADGAASVRTFSIFVRDTEKGVRTSANRMGERLWDKGLYSGNRPKDASGLRLIDANALFNEVASVIRAGEAKDFLYEIETP